MQKKSLFLSLFALIGALVLSGCAETQFGAHVAKQVIPESRSQGAYKIGNPYMIDGQRYHPQESFTHVETGIASWYGPGFHGKQTANGERFDKNELTAAHRTLQMPSLVRVTNLDNGRSLILRVNDRGPFSRGRIIDVSERASELLGFKNRGTAKVRVEVLPDESRRVAELARAGHSTRGYEIALNKQGVPAESHSNVHTAAYGSGTTQPETVPVAQVASVQSEALPPLNVGTPNAPVQGHLSNDGRFMPDPVVTQQPVTPTSIFVQAGSFAEQANAQALSQRLAGIGQAQVAPANVGGRQFYRVRLGPFATVAQADQALNQTIGHGISGATIVVD